jgi:hypothetical protein
VRHLPETGNAGAEAPALIRDPRTAAVAAS